MFMSLQFIGSFVCVSINLREEVVIIGMSVSTKGESACTHPGTCCLE